MKILIVFDSYFGNTEKIARAIAASLGLKNTVEAVRVQEVTKKQLKNLDLLLVGSPTRAFRPTKAIVAFIRKMPAGALKGVRVGAFDTRISARDINSRLLNLLLKVFGYAADPIGGRLRKKGGIPVIAPEGFYVSGTEGPLKDGEPERASAWAKSLVEMKIPQAM